MNARARGECLTAVAPSQSRARPTIHRWPGCGSSHLIGAARSAPRIGARPVSDVTSTEVLEVLTPVWHVKAQTARRVRERIRAVLEWAVAMEWRHDNPCDRIGPVLASRYPQFYPHVVSDAPGLYRTASRAPGSAHGAGAATEPPISVSRPGPERGQADQHGGTAVDTRGTSRTQAAESMRWVAGSEQKNGERTPEAPLAEKSPGTSWEHRSTTRTLGGVQKSKVGIRRFRARTPPLPDYPPGLSGTMGSPSPAAATETAAARRHPSGPARAATAQSTAALALAPAPAQPPSQGT